jgi:signal transduction histidine kinase
MQNFDTFFSRVGGSTHPHACIIFDDLSCYRKIACKFILEGLGNNEKCIMATDRYEPAMIAKDFARTGEDINPCLADERLTILNVRESYSGNGGFDPDKTVKLWQKVTRKAVDQGFTAVRVVGEATFSLGSPELAGKLIYYENIINQVLFPNYPFKSLCVYDKNLYPPEIIKTAISGHPILFYNDELYLENIHYVPPGIYFKKHKARDEIDVWLANVKRNNQNIQSLRANHRKLEAIFDSTHNILMLVDKDCRITKINKHMDGKDDRPKTDVYGLLFGDAFQCIHALGEGGCGQNPKCSRCPVRTKIESTFSTGQPCHDEEGQMIFAAEGKHIPRIFLISTTLLEFDAAPGVLLSMTDITDHKRLEARVLQAQKMESLGNLAGGIAHDFNNLLFPITGIAELLLEDFPRDSPEHESIAEILQAGKRGRDLVKQILSFSRQDEYTKIAVRVQQIVKEVIKLSRSTIPPDIIINQSLQPDCGPVMADPVQLHQIAMNLITNACHAVENSSNGKIDISVKEIAVGEDRLINGLQQPGQYVLLSVADNGTGISPENQAKIFEPYFTTKEQGKGTGLGLAAVYGIVKEHKGDITVHSEVNKGTTFHVFLPA